jgi:hypothetical protein
VRDYAEVDYEGSITKDIRPRRAQSDGGRYVWSR